MSADKITVLLSCFIQLVEYIYLAVGRLDGGSSPIKSEKNLKSFLPLQFFTQISSSKTGPYYNELTANQVPEIKHCA